MSRPAAITLLLSFVSVAVFGILIMNHGDGNHDGCIGASVGGAVCPETDPLAFSAFHLNAFKKFSTAPITDFGNMLSLIALVAFFVFAFARMLGTGTFRAVPVSYPRQQSAEAAFFEKRPFLSWLALHENSPSFS